MVSNSTDAGVKKTSRNEPRAAQHSPEKMKKLLEEAQKEKISDGEGWSADEPVAAAPEPGNDRQSADKEQPNHPNSSHNIDISGDQHRETGSADEPQSENVEMSDAEPDTTNESTSAGPAGAQTRGLNDSTNAPQLLVNFEQLTINDHGNQHENSYEDPQPGDIDGFGGTGRSRFFIFRVGPTRAPIYVFRRTNAYSTDGFKNLSGNRISLLKYETQNGDQHWQHTKKKTLSGLEALPLMKPPTALGVHRHGSRSNGRISRKSTRAC